MSNDSRIIHYIVEVTWQDWDGYRYADTINTDPDIGGAMTLARARQVAATAGPPQSGLPEYDITVVANTYTRIHGSNEMRLLTTEAIEDDNPQYVDKDRALALIAAIPGRSQSIGHPGDLVEDPEPF